MTRKAPRWTIAFLRALERVGKVRAAAEDAGIDHSTAYARRRTHADFKEAWENALRLRSGRTEDEERVAVEDLQAYPLSRLALGESDLSAQGRGDLLASSALGGAQMKRVGEGRWTQAKEKMFFDELAATANVRRAAEAAGVSTNAVYARRMKQPLFRARWAAVLDTGRASIEMHLIGAANRTFDPDEIDVGEIQPRVSVAEAIRIVQLHGSKAEASWAEQMEPPQEDIEAVRERLFNKLERLRKREMARALSEGWSLDESHDSIVPPGWVKGPDYKPRQT